MSEFGGVGRHYLDPANLTTRTEPQRRVTAPDVFPAPAFIDERDEASEAQRDLLVGPSGPSPDRIAFFLDIALLGTTMDKTRGHCRHDLGSLLVAP